MTFRSPNEVLDSVYDPNAGALRTTGSSSSGTTTVSIPNPIGVSGTVSIGNSPTVDTELPAAAALADLTPNPTAPAVGAFPHTWDPVTSTWMRVRGFASHTDTASGASIPSAGPMLWNSRTSVSERVRTANAASGTTGTGLLGAGSLVLGPDALWRGLQGDAGGRVIIVGAAASGSSFLGNPLVIAGADASGNVRTLLTDVLGRATVQGAQANGTAITTNPFIISHIHSDATCRLIGSAAAATNTTGINLLGAGPCLWDSVGGVNFVKQAGDGSGRAIVVGAAAAGTAVSGSPVLIAGSDGTNAQTLKTAPTLASSVSNAGMLYTQIGLWSSAGNVQAWQDAASISDASNAANTAAVAGWSFNGSSWDRTRNNVDATLLASAIRTTTSSGGDITTYNLQGILICLDVTAGSGALTVTVNGKCPASSKYYPILIGTLVTTNSFNVYRIYPGLTAVAGSTVNDHLPRIINIVISHGNANLVAYSVGYTLLV
jgi:hypothetical protein